MSDPFTAIVVAGGKSARLGRDKRQLKLWGEGGPTLLAHTVGLFRTLTDDIVVVQNDAEAWPDLQVRQVADAYPAGGSLGGIATGLAAAVHPCGLVVAADMPLLDVAFLRWIAEQPRNYDILAPRTAAETKSGGWETLCAMYARTCLPLMDEQIRTGNLKIRSVYDRVRVEAIGPETIAHFDSRGMMFQNINTPDDLRLITELIGAV